MERKGFYSKFAAMPHGAVPGCSCLTLDDKSGRLKTHPAYQQLILQLPENLFHAAIASAHLPTKIVIPIPIENNNCCTSHPGLLYPYPALFTRCRSRSLEALVRSVSASKDHRKQNQNEPHTKTHHASIKDPAGQEKVLSRLISSDPGFVAIINQQDAA
jgi:hypothetical protein